MEVKKSTTLLSTYWLNVSVDGAGITVLSLGKDTSGLTVDEVTVVGGAGV